MAKLDPLASLQKQTPLEARKLKIPGLAEFSELLLRDAVYEDIAGKTGQQLAGMAAAAFSHLRDRVPGRPKIVISQLDAPFKDVTAIDIVNDDMPFLVDSTLALLNELGVEISFLLHPVIKVKRDASGALLSVHGLHETITGLARESFMHIHLARIEDVTLLETISRGLETTLNDVRLAVLDWQAMQQRLRLAIAGYHQSPPPVPLDDLTESIAFLQWLLDNHFTFLGMREYTFAPQTAEVGFAPIAETGLGILRNPELEPLRRVGDRGAMSPEIHDFLRLPATLIITKSDLRSTVHRRVALDYVGLKLFSPSGELSGELCIAGLFTSSAYTQNPYEIPLLRRKLQGVVAASGFSPNSHSGKALNNVLETFPRDELFQIDAELLGEMANGILRLDERPRTRLFVRRDRFDRFVSAFLFIPRDRFNTEVRLKAGDILSRAFSGHVASFAPAFSEAPLVRVHYLVVRDPSREARPDLEETEREIVEAVRTWDDRLADAMTAAGMAGRIGRWRSAFPPGYTSRLDHAEALKDLAEIDQLSGPEEVAVEFLPALTGEPGRCRLKLYRNGAPIHLSARLPILENLGFRSIAETTYELRPTTAGQASVAVIHDVLLETASGRNVEIGAQRQLLQDAFKAVWTGLAENDAFNALVLIQNLHWRDVTMLRALARYLRQASATYSIDYLAQTLVKHAPLAGRLVELFYANFDPVHANEASAAAIASGIEQALEAVPSLDEDRIIRRYLNVIGSILRTNYFQPSAPTIAFKIASRKVEDLPEPRPFAEIFVYSPDIEGVHLRGGPIARGGLRWSDRPEDFRTEVLGLAKAQNVKNAVIVPVGAKGGFVPKKLPQGGTRDAIQAEGIRTYKLFVSSLVSLTDNITPSGVVPPKATIRRDGDDPYLVVAADKGTAAFSDIANQISKEQGFWLGDAFASGGSAGYDHKKMAITARGGWEAVKRHFREMDTDIQSAPFTVIGIGDMSGDVFGNGMLLSPFIRLVAAFDHRDIFIDPDPDAAASFAERQRLFALARSSWQDYDKSLISKGGGVFSRQLKAIPLSAEIRALTGLTGETVTPQALMRAILMAETDLIWFGGIGTYVKAASESHADVGDRANDAIRVDAADIRAKVIGEGANLGLTQRARIEFALRGGRINTDAIDNSAGVNSSDVEVNIKIALGAAEAEGKLDRPARNRLLSDMTDEVAALVLRNNYLQTLCLTLAVVRGSEGNGYAMELMHQLERRGLLDRRLEALPSDQVVAERDARGLCLTRPEFAVLLAYAKIALSQDLLASSVPDDPYLARELVRYFPAAMREDFALEIQSHRLRREIIATVLSNSIINRGGPTFVSRLMEETGAAPARIAAAFAVARDSYGFIELNQLVDACDNRIPGALQTELYFMLQKRLTWATLWYLRHEPLTAGLDGIVARYRDGLAAIATVLADMIGEDARTALADRARELQQAGVPLESATRLAAMPYLQRGPDIVLISAETGMGYLEVGRAVFASASALRLDQLVEEIGRMVARDFVERRAINRLVAQLFQTHRAIVARTMRITASPQGHWPAWHAAHRQAVDKTIESLDMLLAERRFDLARLAVAQGMLADLALL